MNFSTLDAIVVLILILVTNAITGLVVHNTVEKHWQKQCNERNVSGFNPVSGKWEWKAPKADVTVVDPPLQQVPLLPPSAPKE
mgnify:CR=1 FL=1